MINHLSKKFAELYQPHCEVATDEAMIKFQGRSCLKQYNPLKPVKHRINVWVLADSHNGYFQKLQVYTGKEGNSVVLGRECMVKTLIAELHEKHHHAFFDNFFTSEKLLQDQLADGVYACGTTRKDHRGFPTMKQAKLPTR